MEDFMCIYSHYRQWEGNEINSVKLIYMQLIKILEMFYWLIKSNKPYLRWFAYVWSHLPSLYQYWWTHLKINLWKAAESNTQNYTYNEIKYKNFWSAYLHWSSFHHFLLFPQSSLKEPLPFQFQHILQFVLKNKLHVKKH